MLASRRGLSPLLFRAGEVEPRPKLDTADGKSVGNGEVMGTCRLRTKVTVKPVTTTSLTLEAFRRWTMQASSSSECPSED